MTEWPHQLYIKGTWMHCNEVENYAMTVTIDGFGKRNLLLESVTSRDSLYTRSVLHSTESIGWLRECVLVAMGADDSEVLVSWNGDSRRDIVVFMNHRALDQAE